MNRSNSKGPGSLATSGSSGKYTPSPIGVAAFADVDEVEHIEMDEVDSRRETAEYSEDTNSVIGRNPKRQKEEDVSSHPPSEVRRRSEIAPEFQFPTAPPPQPNSPSPASPQSQRPSLVGPPPPPPPPTAPPASQATAELPPPRNNSSSNLPRLSSQRAMTNGGSSSDLNTVRNQNAGGAPVVQPTVAPNASGPTSPATASGKGKAAQPKPSLPGVRKPVPPKATPNGTSGGSSNGTHAATSQQQQRNSSARPRDDDDDEDDDFEDTRLEGEAPDVQLFTDPSELIDAQYHLWLQKAQLLYEFCTTHVLEYPSACISFVNGSRREIPGRDYSIQQIVVGRTAPGKVNYLSMYNIFMPCVPEEREEFDEEEVDAFQHYSGHYADVQTIMQRYLRVVHEGPASKIASMPQKSTVFATRGWKHWTYLYDLSRRRSEPETDDVRPDVRLKGHTMEGKALDWNPTVSGYLATGAADMLVNVYDIQAQVELMGTRECVDVGPIVKLQGHNGEVEAVSWHSTHHDILASAGADRIVNIWDIRSNVPQESETLHRAAVKDVKFHPTAAFLLATCSADRSVRVWDLRKLRRPLCELVGHFDTVNGIEWAPFNDLLLQSYSRDRTVICWDVSKTMQPRLPVEDDQAKPELVFQHFGHTANVRQAAWCPHEEDEWSIASVDDNNVLQVWAPHERVYNDEADQEVYGTEGV